MKGPTKETASVNPSLLNPKYGVPIVVNARPIIHHVYSQYSKIEELHTKFS
jgi:hypothetical protein